MNFVSDLVTSVFGFFYEIIFGCRHGRQTRPFTIEAETYKVCLDCGRQIFYSTERMTALSSREIRRMRAEQAQSATLHVMPALTGESRLVAIQGGKKTAAA